MDLKQTASSTLFKEQMDTPFTQVLICPISLISYPANLPVPAANSFLLPALADH